MRLPSHVNPVAFVAIAALPASALAMIAYGLWTSTVWAGMGLVFLATASLVLLAFTMSPRQESGNGSRENTSASKRAA